MKTRAEIYGNEAATLLRTVTMYPGLSQQQLLCFHPGKSETAKALLSHLERQGRISKVITADIFLPAIRPKLIRRLSRRCGSFWISFSRLIIMHLRSSLSNWSFSPTGSCMKSPMSPMDRKR